MNDKYEEQIRGLDSSSEAFIAAQGLLQTLAEHQGDFETMGLIDRNVSQVTDANLELKSVLIRLQDGRDIPAEELDSIWKNMEQVHAEVSKMLDEYSARLKGDGKPELEVIALGNNGGIIFLEKVTE